MSNINPENIVQPKTSNVPTPVKEYVEPVEEKGSGIEPDKKEFNTDGQTKRKFRDGSIREWNWNLPLTDEPMWIVGRKTLGLSDSEASQYQNEIADIMKLTMEILQDDDEFEVIKFLRKELRFTPNSGNRLFNLLHNLIAYRKELDDES